MGLAEIIASIKPETDISKAVTLTQLAIMEQLVAMGASPEDAYELCYNEWFCQTELLNKMLDPGKSVAVLCFGERPPSLGAAVAGALHDTADLFKFEGVDILVPKSDMMIARMITSQDLHELLAEHDKRYDLVIIAATFDQTLNVVRSFAKHSPFIVLLAKPAATLKNILETVKLISTPHAVVSYSK